MIKLAVAAVTALLLCGASFAAFAQSEAGPEAQPPVAQPPVAQTPLGESQPETEDVIAPLPRDATEQAREAHLDQLFGRLAMADNPDWERVQRQIWAAWNHSGSPSMDFLAHRADQAMAEKDYDAALAFLNDLVRLAPEFAEGWNKRATLHFVLEDYGKSLDDIARTLKLEPRHFGALSGLGIILDRIGDQTGALEAYRRAVEIHPNLPGAQDGIRKLSKEVEGRRL